MKYSIRNQFTLVFGILMAATVLLCWFINNTFLEHYYLQDKERLLQSAYRSINQASLNNEVFTSEFGNELWRFCSENNINFIVLSSESRVIMTIHDSEIMRRQLIDNIFGLQTSVSRTLKETQNYQIWIKADQVTQIEFVEMWGILDNGTYFLLRIALEGIKGSVALANRFLAYVGVFAVFLSGLITYFVAKKTTDPLMELVEISERMIHLDFDAKYQGHSNNEVALLGNNINEMSLSLENTISELKSANNELERDIRKKEQIEQMRSEFISNVSHELKTPIALIQGYAEGLLEGVSDDQESRDYYCEVIVDEAAKMNEVVKKLLTLNELEFGNTQIQMERFDIVLMITNFLQSVEILLKQSNVKIEFDEAEPIFVWADEYKVIEVFNNYFTNALNHVAVNGVVRITLTKLNWTVRVCVWNEGDGIAEESIPYLWDKFYKADKARTRTYGGSGIGLSIVKAIMEALNRRYGVRNTENGVEFWFELDYIKNNGGLYGS
ncbi:MAG: HAMP domain-containing histidine kinase [Lachnospiraceae bacterium]|nr:HAMP domain-containing histidine kinase [Lachnospiraceae bacterium]